MSPLRSDHSLHLDGRNAHEKKRTIDLLFLSASLTEVYLAWVECVLLSLPQFYCCQWDQEALKQQNIFWDTKVIKICVGQLTGSYHCLCPSQSSPTLWTTACWCTGSPSEPPQPETLCSAADKKTCSVNIKHRALSRCSCRVQTLMKVSISVFLRLARASISTWQMAHIYRWFTAGPPPKLGVERPTFNRKEGNQNQMEDWLRRWFSSNGYVFTCCKGIPTHSGERSQPGRLCSGIYSEGSLYKHKICSSSRKNPWRSLFCAGPVPISNPSVPSQPISRRRLKGWEESCRSFQLIWQHQGLTLGD